MSAANKDLPMQIPSPSPAPTTHKMRSLPPLILILASILGTSLVMALLRPAHLFNAFDPQRPLASSNLASSNATGETECEAEAENGRLFGGAAASSGCASDGDTSSTSSSSGFTGGGSSGAASSKDTSSASTSVCGLLTCSSSSSSGSTVDGGSSSSSSGGIHLFGGRV